MLARRCKCSARSRKLKQHTAESGVVVNSHTPWRFSASWMKNSRFEHLFFTHTWLRKWSLWAYILALLPRYVNATSLAKTRQGSEQIHPACSRRHHWRVCRTTGVSFKNKKKYTIYSTIIVRRRHGHRLKTILGRQFPPHTSSLILHGPRIAMSFWGLK